MPMPLNHRAMYSAVPPKIDTVSAYGSADSQPASIMFICAPCLRIDGSHSLLLDRSLRMTSANPWSVTIYHNPDCGTSRNTLALIRHAGIEPTVIEYLLNPPTRAELIGLIQDAGLSPRDALREKGTPYAELGLSHPDLADDQLIDAMLAHPILIGLLVPVEQCTTGKLHLQATSFVAQCMAVLLQLPEHAGG